MELAQAGSNPGLFLQKAPELNIEIGPLFFGLLLFFNSTLVSSSPKS